MSEMLTDAELTAINATAFVEAGRAKFTTLELTRLLRVDIPKLIAELRLTREQLQSRTDQCTRQRAIIENGAEVAT